jgi:hypothetical protein
MSDKGLALGKYGAVGIGIQSVKGQTLSTGFVWCPLAAQLGFARDFSPTEFRPGDMHHYLHWVYPASDFWGGDLPLYVVPGMCELLWGTSTGGWCQTRDSSNQGKWANICILQYFDDSGTAPLKLVRRAIDCKISELDIDFEPGAMLRANIRAFGLKDDSAAAFGTPAPNPTVPGVSLLTIPPYLSNEMSLTFLAKSVDTSTDIKRLSLRWNNHVQEPREGMRFTGQTYPACLYNEGEIDVRGSLTRDMVNSDLYDLFVAQNDASGKNWYSEADGYLATATVTISRSTVTADKASISVPRIHLTSHAGNPLGSNLGIVEETSDWIALGFHYPISPDDGHTNEPAYITVPAP